MRKRNDLQMWTYKGVDVFRAVPNASMIRWYARTDTGTLRADTKANMRKLINERKAPNPRPSPLPHIRAV